MFKKNGAKIKRERIKKFLKKSKKRKIIYNNNKILKNKFLRKQMLYNTLK